MIRLAVATDDRETVRFGHFGDAEHYLIFDVDDAGVAHLVEERENDFTDEKLGLKTHNQPQKALMMLDFLGDCRAFVGHSMGDKNKMILQAGGVLPVALRRRDVPVEEAIAAALQALNTGGES